ncbi:MAG: aldolase [Gammaproteobacteria bacterium]|jgi:hypothetical protein|nr:aldolase [Gammaproteobacteria bacterium]|tara:strand:- start:180 stop:500 length:321 start_codon:yes stop_codon:yes gene_type:complete
MTTFDDRKKAEEARFKHDQEFQFKVTARRNKLLGHWAAELMNMAPAEASAYATSVVKADFEEAGDADVVRKVLGDLSDNNIECDEDKLRVEMERLMKVAESQLHEE